MDIVTLTIDGTTVKTTRGKTVLDAATDAGIEIPTICHHEALPDYGACRMCVVEIDNVRGYPTSCTMLAEEGMVVRTRSAKLAQLRGQVFELMMSGHPNACLVCDHREDCEKYRPNPGKTARPTRCGVCSNRSSCMIRDMSLASCAGDLNLPTLYCNYNLQRDDPFMDRDHNLCILCGRCWRICEAIHGKPAISINNRGRWARIGTSFDKSYVDSGCTFCGACIDICPTGTLTDRYARWYGKAEARPNSVCMVCPQGCELTPMVSAGRVTATAMTAFTRDQRLCAVGRFAYAQLMNATQRLTMPMIRENGELIPVDWDEATAFVADRLQAYRGGGFLAIVDETTTRESMHLYQQFTDRVMQGTLARIPAGRGLADIADKAIVDGLRRGAFTAVLTTGAYLDEPALEAIEYLLVADCLPSAELEKADAVLPVAILSELDGTFRNAAGEVRSITAAADPPGEARGEWTVISDLATAMGAEGFACTSVADVMKMIVGDPAPTPLAGAPRDVLRDIPVRFRGHLLADVAPALTAIGLPASPEPPRPALEGGFRIVEKEEVVPNFHLLTIEAPSVARYAKPGQFIIVMVSERSERVPFTLVDWDADAGTIKLVIEEVGRSSGEIAALKAGDMIAHVTGPLGLPLPIDAGEGTVVLGGGCYGVGAIYPIARALREAGRHVICVLEASSSFLMYMDEEMRAVCDELIIVTKDGSRGDKGGVQEAFLKILDRPTPVEQFIAIGCTFMMRMVARETRDRGVPLVVAMNPIMVDGTGMCGACRLTVGGETKFACVDGPFFDGHAIDWDELDFRRSAYATEEIEAMPQGAHARSEVTELTVAGCAMER